jgi:hypothetical protein
LWRAQAPFCQSLARNKQRTGKEKVPDIAIFATMKQFVYSTYKECFDTLFCVVATDNGIFNVSCVLKRKDE